MLESIFQSPSFHLVLAQAEQVTDQLKFYQKSWFVFLLLIAAIFLGWLLAKLITQSLKVNEYRGRLAVVLIALSVASLMIWAKWPPKLGVDLRGGINMIGSLNLDAFLDENNSGETPKAKDIIPALIQRVNPSGTKEIMIRPLGDDKIEVTIPSVDPQEADDIWDRLVRAGKLEFRIVADAVSHGKEFSLARKMADEGGRGRKVFDRDEQGNVIVDENGNAKTAAVWVALARKIPEGAQPGQVHPIKFVPDDKYLVRDKSTGKILDLSGILRQVDPKYREDDFAAVLDSIGVRVPQILVIQPDEEMNVEGKHLAGVRYRTDSKGLPSLGFTATSDGTTRMGMLTRLNIDRALGIVLDGQLHSAPNINSAIYGNGTIEGDFTKEEVEELIINLESGKLDVALNKSPISRDFIESTLGQELKEKGILAIAFSLVIVLIFMVIYYRFAGIVATIALLLNLILILALVMAINQPLTLTGLAGLVLTVGMSVDANVLIFERIREELDRGAALRMAIRNGFDKATTTIVDANVTTLITAIVLYVIGTEQIKGFSVTLILGILMSMFTAIYVARLIFDICERKRWLTKLNMTRILDQPKWQFLNKVSMTGIISACLIIAGLVGMWSLGAKILNHDLRGGSTVRVVFNEDHTKEDVVATLSSKAHEHEGEELEFSVSGLGDSRVFKIDSNLPAWEGVGSGVEKFKQLPELIQEEFKGKLKLHHVEIEGVDLGAAVGMKRNSRPMISGINTSIMSLTAATTGIVSYQETPETPPVLQVTPGSAQEGSTPAVVTETTPPVVTQETTPAETAPGKTMPQIETKSGDTLITPSTGIAPSTGSSNAGTIGAAQDPTTPDAAPTSGGNFPGTESAQLDGFQRSEVKVSRKMTVTPAISGKSLRALIVEASNEADLGLEDDQVRVSTPDVKDDESPLSTISEDWSVDMDVASEGEADRILTIWGKKFNKQPYFPTSSKVGGQIAGQTQLQALAAIIASLLGIIAYVWIRFQNVAFGLAAVIALIHDVLIVLGAIALSHWLAGALGILGVVKFKISLEIVAALLTVIGYSLNDTIVVFDRIREVRGKRTEITAEMINSSISQTLSRTILTSVTTFIVVFILYCFGGEAIHGFAFALVVGVVVGTYSSIFIASPALLWLMNTVGLNPGVVDPAVE